MLMERNFFMDNVLDQYLLTKRLELVQTGSVVLRLKIIPNASKTEWTELLVGEKETMLKLKVAAVPEKGKANKVIEKFVAKFFGARAEIIRGQTRGSKLVKISIN